MTKFSEKHMGNSPVKQLGKNRADRLIKRAQKRSEKGGETGGYNYSDEKVVKLLDKAKKLKNKKSGKSYGEDTRVSMSFERPDMDASPLNGYVDGEERVSHYQPTADLYKGMIDTLTSSVDKIAGASGPENMAKRKALKADRLDKRMDKIDKKFADPNYDYDDGMALDDKKRKLATKQAEAKADQVSFENIANKNKNNQFDKLTSIMSKEDKEKYGLT